MIDDGLMIAQQAQVLFVSTEYLIYFEMIKWRNITFVAQNKQFLTKNLHSTT